MASGLKNRAAETAAMILLLLSTTLTAVDMRQVTTHPDIDLSPRVSPDGAWVAFVNRISGNFDVWIQSTAGGRAHRITSHKADDYYPAWSPDGERLYFVSQRSDAAGDIWTIRIRRIRSRMAARGEAERVTRYFGFDGYPTLSPDGRRLAWVSDRSGRQEIWLRDLESDSTKQITFEGATQPAWSPVEDRLACTTFRSGASSNGDIWLVDLNGGAKALTRGPAMDGFPSWSKEGDELVYTRIWQDTDGNSRLTPADRGQIWTMRLARDPAPSQDTLYAALAPGSFSIEMVDHATPLTSGAHQVSQPWFGADDRIYFCSDRGNNLDVWSLPRQGHLPRLDSAEQQLRLAEETVPLPLHLSEGVVGPLLLGKQSDEHEGLMLRERILAFRRVIDFHGMDSPHAAMALYQMAVSQRFLEERENCQRTLQVLLKRFSRYRDVAALAELALLGLETKGRGEQALSGLAQLIERYKDLPRIATTAQIALADLYFREADYARAFSLYADVEAKYPQQRDACAESQLKIGDVFSHYASEDEVVRAYLNVVERYPDRRKWLILARNRILDLLTRGIPDPSKRIARYREICGQYRSFDLLAAAAQLRIAELFASSGDLEAAVREYEVVPAEYENLTEEVFQADMARAELLLDLRESLFAFRLFEELMERYAPERLELSNRARDALVRALLRSGDLLKRFGDYELASARYQRAHELSPANVDAHRGYIECQYYLRNIDAVIEKYQSAVRGDERNNILIYALGLAYSYKGTARAELDNEYYGLDVEFLHESTATIARALTYDFTLVQAYLTQAYNYEMIETYLTRLQQKPVGFLRRTFNTLITPVRSLYRTLTFYEEPRPRRYYERAIHELTKALSLNNEAENPGLEANLALNLANNYYNLGEFGFEKAYEYYHLKLAYDSTFADDRRKNLIYERMGHCALTTEDGVKGPQYLLSAVAYHQEKNDPDRTITNLKRLALLYEIGERHDLAIEYYQKAAEIEQLQKRHTDLMRSYRSIAYNYLLLSESREAIRYARRALDLLETGKVRRVKEEALRVKMGFLGIYLPVPFLDLRSMGFTSAAVFTTEDERALIYTILGEAYTRDKRYQEAFVQLEQKRKVYQRRKDRSAEAAFLNNMGYLAYLQMDLPRAWDLFNRSLERSREEDNVLGIVTNSLNLARLYYALGGRATERHRTLVTEALNRALILSSELGGWALRARCHLYLWLARLSVNSARDRAPDLEASVRATLSGLESAFHAGTYLEEALKLSRRLGSIREECLVLYETGLLLLHIAEPGRAHETLTRCRRLALREGLFDLVWRLDTTLGDLLSNMSRPLKRELVIQKDAFEYYAEAIKIIEADPETRTGAENVQLRRLHRIAYLRAIRYLAKIGDGRGALSLVESMRAQHFLDMIRSENLELQRERHKIFFGNARYLQQEIQRLELARLRDNVRFSEQLGQYQNEYQQLLIQVREEVPALEPIIHVPAFDLRAVQARLRPREAVLTYIADRDTILAWLITSDDLRSLGLPGRDSTLIRQGGELVSPKGTGAALKALLSVLPRELTDVVIVPDWSGLMWPWSFALMSVWAPDQPPAVTVCPSLVDYRFAFDNRKIHGRNIYSAGSPQLAAQLRRDGYRLIPALAGRGENSFPAQSRALSTADLIHMRVESEWNLVDPANCRFGFPIRLSPPAIFSTTDLYPLSLRAGLFHIELDRDLRDLDAAEAWAAWHKALIYSGIPSVLVNLWPAADSTLLRSFYQLLPDAAAASSLSEAQWRLFNSDRPASDWAGYQLYGFGGMSGAEERQYSLQSFESRVRYGNSAYEAGEWIEAVQSYEQALQMAQRAGDVESQARLKTLIWESAVNGALWGKAIEIQQEMVDEAESRNDINGLVSGYSNLAYFYTRNGDIEGALDYKTRFTRLAERYGLAEQEAIALRETGLIYERGRNPDQAISLFRQAAEKFRRLDMAAGEARCLRDIGRINFFYLDDYPGALAVQLQALVLFRTLEPGPDLVDLLQNIGLTCEKMADYHRALEYQREAMEIAASLGDEAANARGEQYLANLHWKMGAYQRALIHQEIALDAFTRSAADSLLQIALATRGLIALSLGRSREALDYERRALLMAEKGEIDHNRSAILKNIAMIHRLERRWDDALSALQQAARIDSSIGSARGRAYALRHLSAVYMDMDSTNLAYLHVRAAERLSLRLGDRRNRLHCLLILGQLALRRNQPDSALHYLGAAAGGARQLFIPEIEWRAYRDMANASVRGRAIGHLERALEVIEDMRSRIKVEEYSSGFMDDKISVYGELIALLIGENHVQRALYTAERAKSRSFLDLLGNRKISFRTREAGLLARVDSLRSQMLVLQNRVDAARDSLDREMAQIRTALSTALAEIRRLNPELSDMLTVDPWPVDKIRAVLPPGTALLEFYLHENTLTSWWVDSKGVNAAVEQRFDISLDRQIAELRKSLGNGGVITAWTRPLYQRLIGPWEDRLPRIEHLVIVPHGPLHYLPVALLQNGEGEYLGFKVTTSLAPSATVLGFCLEKGLPFLDLERDSAAVLAFGNPDLGDPEYDLPFAEKEVRSLGRYFPRVTTFLGSQATESRFYRQSDYPPYVLFSCHGRFDPSNPMHSALILAPDSLNDGRLEVNEIFSLEMNSALVALSACETGLGAVRTGDEVVGLVRSTIYAGSASLMASSWKVDDLATAVLVKRFFRYLSEGKSRARALQMAQKTVYQYIDPYPAYWAAFTLTGDFR